jgi:hypothetical protein
MSDVDLSSAVNKYWPQYANTPSAKIISGRQESGSIVFTGTGYMSVEPVQIHTGAILAPAMQTANAVLRAIYSAANEAANVAQAAEASATMPEPSREEFEAKLATVEARTETRFVELSGKIDRIADAITSSNNSLTQQVSTLRTDVDRDLRAVLADNRNTRWTIVITIVAAILAALAALWGTQASLLSAFQAGLAVHGEQQQQQTAPPATQKKGS